MSCEGTCKSFNLDRGWGFVMYKGEQIFLHAKHCVEGLPQPGDMLYFDIEQDTARGPDCKRAMNVIGGSAPLEAGCGPQPGKGKTKGFTAWGKGGKGDASANWGGPYGGGSGGWGKDDWSADPMTAMAGAMAAMAMMGYAKGVNAAKGEGKGEKGEEKGPSKGEAKGDAAKGWGKSKSKEPSKGMGKDMSKTMSKGKSWNPGPGQQSTFQSQFQMMMEQNMGGKGKGKGKW
eukprot:gnl/TRDRNA2_/TRDRNA2_173090_c1_seq1.p1 gnl/TRDRNA2_/TRDRNA2_173090_c1~~gnl/TRDRNA2_/TRDRNA2_173090_c1_seq1.p1  ORF type:complete len:231 (-),score=59.90 gnl/TRDRNA2_/TRDRNA2_173090_c1_seq1:89-781(-)